MLTNNEWAEPEHFRINMLIGNDNGRTLRKGTSNIYYDLNNVNGRMVRGDFDEDGHINEFILINKTGASSMRFDLFESDGHNSHPSFTQSNGVYTLNGYDPDKITGRIVSGDFDGDGYWDDIAAFYDYGNGETRIHTFRSNGSTFVYSSSVGWWNSNGYTADRITDRVVSGDFDHDGHVDDIAAFYDYGNEIRVHVWLSGGLSFSYQSSFGWATITGFEASDISKRVVSLNLDRDGHNYDDIAVFSSHIQGYVIMKALESNGSSFDYNPTSRWSSSSIQLSTLPYPSPDNPDFFSGKVVEYDSRKKPFQGKPSDIIGFHNLVTSRYRFWKSRNFLGGNFIYYSEPKYCESKSNFEEDPNSKEEVTVRRESSISAYPNPTKSFTTLQIPESLINEKTEIQISNIYGELVFSTSIKSSAVSIDLSRQKSGIYLAKVIGRESTNILKIIKE